jgi:hypothetical protein
LAPDLKIPVITEECEKIKSSIVSKFSDIQSLSVIADEWVLYEIPFCILSCTAITKSYEHFKCFLGCKFNDKFSSRELVKKCEEVIPDFRSKVINLFPFISMISKCGFETSNLGGAGALGWRF